MKVLNFGCNDFRMNGFTNIDINAQNGPDVVMDLRNLRQNYAENEVDFIYAGHFFEHISWDFGKKLMQDVHSVLKPYSSIVISVPDYVKTAQQENIENAERIILNYGNHVALYNLGRLEELARQAGFQFFTEVELERVPWLLRPGQTEEQAMKGILPEPEKWQTAFMAMKVPPFSMRPRG
jgi:predicted SAM-dependent methyltransferase